MISGLLEFILGNSFTFVVFITYGKHIQLGILTDSGNSSTLLTLHSWSYVANFVAANDYPPSSRLRGCLYLLHEFIHARET